MQLIIDLPNREDMLAQHRQRWREVCEDDRWKQTTERIETNAYGQIVMTPPPSDSHSSRQGNLAFELRVRLGGLAKSECPVVTSDGIKVVDVVWLSDQRHQSERGVLVRTIAPEICVEVMSLSNTMNEVQNKFKLYFEAGAVECWQCDLNGQMTYYLNGDADKPHSHSKLCPDFPNHIAD
ncbi:MAG: Uma2 family endonuclease [Planctomycetota bacterium]